MIKTAKMSRRADQVLRTTTFQGLAIHLDRPKGFKQTLQTPEGEKVRTYTCDYGFFPGTKDADGEELDVFLGSDPHAYKVWVIRQNKHDGSFDEHKIMMGFSSEADALRTYSDHIPPELMADVEEISFTEFQERFLGKKTAASALAEKYLQKTADEQGSLIAAAVQRLVKELKARPEVKSVKFVKPDRMTVKMKDTVNPELDRIEFAKLDTPKAVFKYHLKDGRAGWGWDAFRLPEPVFHDDQNVFKLGLIVDPSRDTEREIAAFVKHVVIPAAEKVGTVFIPETKEIITLSERAKRQTQPQGGDSPAFKKVVADLTREFKKLLPDPKFLDVSVTENPKNHDLVDQNGVPYGPRWVAAFKIARTPATLRSAYPQSDWSLHVGYEAKWGEVRSWTSSTKYGGGNSKPYAGPATKYVINLMDLNNVLTKAQLAEKQERDRKEQQLRENPTVEMITEQVKEAIDAVSKKMSANDGRQWEPAELNGRWLGGEFRLSSLDDESEWDREDLSEGVAARAEKLLASKLDDIQKHLGTISVEYGSKGWYTIGVELKAPTKMAADRPASPSQISYVQHLLKQVDAKDPGVEQMSGTEVSALIDDLKKKRGKPVWYGNGQFSHWEKSAMSTSSRVADRFISRRASTLGDLLVDLKDLDLLANNIEKVVETFGEHFKLAAVIDPKVQSQLEALQKARKGLEAAKLISEKAKEVLTSFPEDKTAARAVKDAETMVKRFDKLEADTAKMIRTLSQKQMPPALADMGKKVAAKIKGKLVDSKVLQVIPWQRATQRHNVTGAEFQVVFRIEDKALQTYNHRAEVILKQDTTDPSGKVQVSGDYSNEAATVDGVFKRFMDQLQGWPGVKGESEANAKRAEAAKRITSVLNSLVRRLSHYDYNEAESDGPMNVHAAFRQSRLEDLAEWDRDETSSKVSKSTVETIKKALGSDMDAVSRVQVHYGEKGWYEIDVTLK